MTINSEYSGVPIADKKYHLNAFYLALKTCCSSDNELESIWSANNNSLWHLIDESGLQDNCAVRNVVQTRALASLLIDDAGQLKYELLPLASKYLESTAFSLAPEGQQDAARHQQVAQVLRLLQSSSHLVRLLLSIEKPHAHRVADQIIRDTLALPYQTIVDTAKTRRAALAAWMCYLRQNVGSCFATAPAIIIHDEQPTQFLRDIQEMLTTGRLKRTFGGVEYAVPLCHSWGVGDLGRLVAFTREQVFQSEDILVSPGIVAAFTASSLVNPSLPEKEQQQQVRCLLLRALQKRFLWTGSELLITTEELIKQALLEYLHLDESAIKQQTPKPVLHPMFAIATHIDAQHSFDLLWERCRSAFKALADNALLRSWEYTLASFAEAKPLFSKWNLYASLGLNASESGGIGECLFFVIKEQFEFAKADLEELIVQSDNIVLQINILANRLGSAGSESEARGIRSEYQLKSAELYHIRQLYEQKRLTTERMSSLFDELIDAYEALFSRYFQEVYDPNIREVSTEAYDDSPAGFRLLYKHGRDNTSQWSLIFSASDFIDYLANFFIATEGLLAAELPGKEFGQLLSTIVTAVVTHVKTEIFLKTALERMARAHGVALIPNALEQLDKVEKKPWVYTSGGSMKTLLSCYFGRGEPPTETSRWVESPLELLIFLVDTLKQMPHEQSQIFTPSSGKALLMHSPTHAFLFKPGHPSFAPLWQNNEYTFIWLRDQIIRPREYFIDNLLLDEVMMSYLVNKLSEQVSVDYRHYFRKAFSRLYGAMTPAQFRSHIMEGIASDRGLRTIIQPTLMQGVIDSTLYTLLPLFPAALFSSKVQELVSNMSFVDTSLRYRLVTMAEEASEEIPSGHLLDADVLYGAILAFFCRALPIPFSSCDIPGQLATVMRQLGYAMPSPIFFADSNWMRDLFAFVLSPATGSLELWRVDSLGRRGAPMTSWKRWLDGSNCDRLWGVCTRYYEYMGKY